MEKPEKKEIRIRSARQEDAAALLQIYAPYVRETAITFEYEVPTQDEFQARICKTLEKFPYLVAEDENGIVGYAYAGSFHARAAYDYAVETSIYVDRAKRKSGIGRLLHDALAEELRKMGILNMYACIAAPASESDPFLDRGSISFHTRMGYRMAGEFLQCGYKFQRWYNMVYMERIIGTHKEKQPPVRWKSACFNRKVTE